MLNFFGAFMLGHRQLLLQLQIPWSLYQFMPKYFDEKKVETKLKN
jgi:hypothetical protein